MAMQQISGFIKSEVHEKLKSHPLRRGKTLSDFYEYILEKYLESPESQNAVLREELENERLEKECWKRAVEQLKKEKQSSPALVAVPAAPPAPQQSGEPEGDFAAVIEVVAGDESPSRSAADLTLAMPDGRTFVDRIVDFPPTPRAAHFRKAVGLAAGDSIIRNAARVVKKSVAVRRTKNPDTSGPKFLTFYYAAPAAETQTIH